MKKTIDLISVNQAYPSTFSIPTHLIMAETSIHLHCHVLARINALDSAFACTGIATMWMALYFRHRTTLFESATLPAIAPTDAAEVSLQRKIQPGFGLEQTRHIEANT